MSISRKDSGVSVGLQYYLITRNGSEGIISVDGFPVFQIEHQLIHAEHHLRFYRDEQVAIHVVRHMLPSDQRIVDKEADFKTCFVKTYGLGVKHSFCGPDGRIYCWKRKESVYELRTQHGIDPIAEMEKGSQELTVMPGNERLLSLILCTAFLL